MEADGHAHLAGRVALVTGGGTGLGRAISLRLAENGCRVAVNFSRSQAEATGVAAQIGQGAIAVKADVSSPEEVRTMVDEVEASLGPVEILVANAGVTEHVPFAELDRLTVELWERILRINVLGAFLPVQAVVPGMLARGFGRVVFVSSNAAFVAAGSSIPYVVSKGALLTLTQCLARTLAPTVQVNAVAPGWMDTPWLDKYLSDERARELRSGTMPLADVADVAEAIADLASNASTTGQTLVVDRGEMWLTRG